MITQLKVEGFKSFGMGTRPIHLQKLNFVVGANASGKTNVVSALRFLKVAVMNGVDLAVDTFGGLAEVRNKILRERLEAKPLTLKLKFASLPRFTSGKKDLTLSDLTYEVKLDVRTQSGAPEVEAESLTAKILGEPAPLDYRMTRDRREVEISDPFTTRGGASQRIPVPPQETSRLALGVGFYSVPCVLLRSYIANWSFFNINPQVARTPFKEIADVNLGPAGEYLSVILHRIEKENGKGSIESIISGLKGGVPGFKGVKTTQLPVENKWAFQILEERIKGAINPESASDGTIRLLALMVIATWSSRHSSLLAIEEPENGLHPHLSEHIVSVLREAAQRTQILVTTHNPDFLDFLQPDEVLLCDKAEGFTTIQTAADIEAIKSFQSKFRLGELWEQGVLGGIP
jgi:predicted ATPase